MRTRDDSGFSMLEMLVAVAVMGVVTSQLFMLLNSQKRVYMASERVLDVQEDTRTVIDLIAYDARMAGFMVPRSGGVASVDGGVNAADRLCISDSSYFDSPALDPNTLTYPSSTLSRLTEFDGAIPALAAGDRTALTTLNVDESTEADRANDFVGPGRGVILSDGVRAHCARITEIQITTIIFDPPLPFAFAAPEDVRVVPAVIYELDENTLTLTRNGLVVATGIEDLQAEYWIDDVILDANGDGNGRIDNDTEFPVHDLTQPPIATRDLSKLRRVRISVVTRTDQEENPGGHQIDNRMRPASANRVAGPSDTFRRRRFVTSVLPRNYL